MGNDTMHDPTYADLMRGLWSMFDDIAYYNWLEGCKQAGYGSIEQDFLDAQARLGITLDRIHNCSPDSPLRGSYDIPPGIECCYPENLGALPPGPYFQSQIAAFNRCVPKEAVIAAGEAAKQTLHKVGDALRAALPDPKK